MKKNTRFFALTIGFLLFYSMIGTTSATEYSVGTSFTLEIDVRLNGGTDWYEGYTEREDETREYTITSVEDDIVSWEMYRDYKLDASESQYDESDENTYEFQTSATTRRYLNGTNDGATDSNFYIYDYIWFRIHPDEIEVGDTVQILGFDYTYEGLTDIRFSPSEGITAMEFTTYNQHYQINDTDYDPDDFVLDVEYDETFYFHPDTGYLLKSQWEAKGTTDHKGSFRWHEEIVLTQSTFPVEYDTGALFRSYLPILITLGVFSGFGGLVIVSVRVGWRYQVNTALKRISGKRKDRAKIDYGDGPSIWDPDKFTYKYLLDDYSGWGGSRLYLDHGIYLIIETDNRLVLADTTKDKRYGTKILEQSNENLRLFYRLALGIIDANSAEARFFDTIPGISGHYNKVQSDKVGFIDRHTYMVYKQSPISSDLFEEALELLARRKVLDYSHGQAPLSPQSYVKKVELILTFDPKNLILIGDDDLISIALARRGIKVDLVEIDPYTCALIAAIAKQENLPIEITQADLRDPLPSKFLSRYDLFVADPDFSVESLSLFVSRGLAAIRVGGNGLINFENNYSQRYRAQYLLNQLNVEVIDEIDEVWKYTIVQNMKVPISPTRSRGSYYRSGKYSSNYYSSVQYKDDLVLQEASFSSKTYIIRRKPDTRIPLDPSQSMFGDPQSIYDY